MIIAINITLQFNESTGDIVAGMSPQVGLLGTHRTPSGKHILIWEPPGQEDKSGYDRALKKQKDKPKLRSV